MICTPTSCAPYRPMTLKMAASRGIAMTPPRKRGTTTRRIGIDGHHFHRRELVRGTHQTELGGERRAGAAREEERRDHGAQLAHQSDRGRAAERLLRAEPLQELNP